MASSNRRRSGAMPSCCEGALACRTNRHWTYMRRCCHSMRYEEHSDEKRLAYNANWTCRSHAFKKNIMKDDLIVEAVADGDNDAIRAILADVCSQIGRASCRERVCQYV